MKPPEKLYEFHVANLHAIEIALDKVALTLREAIAQNDVKMIPPFMRLFALLLASWAECRLSKLLYEPKGFTDLERSGIAAKGTQIERWLAAIESAFRKHYNIPNAVLSVATLQHSAWSRYESVVQLVNDGLRPIIELRNKLAHGQWEFPLNDDGNDIAQAQMDVLRAENLLSLQFKKSLISSLSGIVNDLVVSRPAFERDFDRHYQLIVQTRRNLVKRSYAAYASKMQEKYKRGQEERKNAALHRLPR
jgi:hypothetical protein